MPEAHLKTRHRAATLTAAAIGTALAPWIWALPAAASPAPLPTPPSPGAAAPAVTASPTPASCTTIRYGAAASADVLRVVSENPSAFGTNAAALRDVGAGEARATLQTKP